MSPLICLVAYPPAPGVVAGLVALEEKMPSGHGMKLVRLSSWVCILLGVTSLAGVDRGVWTGVWTGV